MRQIKTPAGFRSFSHWYYLGRPKGTVAVGVVQLGRCEHNNHLFKRGFSTATGELCGTRAPQPQAGQTAGCTTPFELKGASMVRWALHCGFAKEHVNMAREITAGMMLCLQAVIIEREKKKRANFGATTELLCCWSSYALLR